MRKIVLPVLLMMAVVSCKKDTNGCMDETANNYNPAATLDNGSCTYSVIQPVLPDPTCDGHDTDNSLFPLIVGASYTYDQNGTSQDYYVDFVGTVDISGVIYHEADWSQLGGGITGTKEYRVDTNGDVLVRSLGVD